jgi:Co/Zn/Cd efflux system component
LPPRTPTRESGLNHNHCFGQDRKRPGENRTLIVIGVTAVMMGIEVVAGIIMDPLMGIVGAVMVRRWSVGLLRPTSHVLLDRQAPVAIRQKVVDLIQKNGDNQVVDLHLWAVGPGIYAAILSVSTGIPQPPEYYKQLIAINPNLVHVTVEVNPACNSTGYSRSLQ